MRSVTKEEFNKFLDDYPNPLKSGCTTICEPPFRSYRDETLPTNGKVGDIDYYFDKEVARVNMEWIGPNGEKDVNNTGEFWKYMIKDN